jgi:hypothetical protein
LLFHAVLHPDKAFFDCVAANAKVHTKYDCSTHAAKALLLHAALHPDKAFSPASCVEIALGVTDCQVESVESTVTIFSPARVAIAYSLSHILCHALSPERRVPANQQGLKSDQSRGDE